MSTSECQVEQLLEKALIIIELTNDLKEKSHIGEKYACDLKSLAWKACQVTSAIQQSTKDFLQLAEHIVKSALDIMMIDKVNDDKSNREKCESILDKLPPSIEIEKESVTKDGKDSTSLIYDELIKLRNILKRDIYLCEKPSEVKLFKTKSSSSLGDMIKTLQTKHHNRKDRNLSPRICMDEKYPEKTSRESLLDQGNPSLQTVLEDGFTDFTHGSSLETHIIRNNSGHSLDSIQRIKRIINIKDGSGNGTAYVGRAEIDGSCNIFSQSSTTTAAQLDLFRSYSLGSIGPTDSETLIKSNSSKLLQNITEED